MRHQQTGESMRSVVCVMAATVILAGCSTGGVPKECQGIQKTVIGGKTYYVTEGGGTVPAYCTKYATEMK